MISELSALSKAARLSVASVTRFRAISPIKWLLDGFPYSFSKYGNIISTTEGSQRVVARNALLVASILESKVKFIAADKPLAKPLDHLEDAIKAEREGEAISRRTKVALKEAKKRGVQLGKNGLVLAEQNKEASKKFAEKLCPMIRALMAVGFSTIQSLTDELNHRRIATYRAKSKWHKSTVHKLLSKI
jgi:hypothetical protein